MVDDHHKQELKQGETLGLLKAIIERLKALGADVDTLMAAGGGSSKFDLYLRVATILGVAGAIVVGYARGGI